MKPRDHRRWRWGGLALAVTAGLGCSGTIDPLGGTGGQPPGGGDTSPKLSGCGDVNPGRVVVHRLNRVEYNNTVRDLLGDTSNPANDFPPDDAAGGFDNNAAVLNINADLFARYEATALKLAQTAVAEPGFMPCAAGGTGDTACARQVLEPLARRAWRRPPMPAEVAQLTGLVERARGNGSTLTQAVALAVQSVLLSPHFLFRIEYPPAAGAAGAFSLDAHALASRLSYFLWSSMPDPELFAAADSGKLRGASELAAQVGRMLADPKANALAANLAAGWLLGRKAEQAVPLASKFPRYDDDLRASIAQEVARFVGAFVAEDRDLRDMTDADFTFVDQRLAEHYGIKGVSGTDFRRVPLPDDSHRGGLLTQASFLVATAHADQPSIPRRGLSMQAALFCFVPPPQPAGVDEKQKMIEKTLGPSPTRRQVALARDMTGCGSCHNNFDPVGLALDNYDAVGVWRDYDEADAQKRPIDPSGSLGTAGSFTTAREMFGLIKKDERMPGCMASTLFRYALGRSTASEDQCVLGAITRGALDKGFRARDLVAAIAASPAFRFQNR